MLDYRDKPNRQMCRLYLSLMDKMGLRVSKFGDALTDVTQVPETCSEPNGMFRRVA